MKLRSIYVLLVATLLTLGACTSTKRVGDPEADKRAAAAEAALEDLRDSLASAQGALGTGSNTEQREKAREAVVAARADLKRVTASLGRQPASAARTAAQAALTAVDKALELTVKALAATDDALAPGAGPASLTSMHTALDRAQAALDEAQASLTAALAAKPSTEIKTLLAQAQATLSTAQVSLVPELRRELANVRRGGTTLGIPIAPERFARNIAPAFSTGGTANVTWTPRTDTTGAVNPNRLEIKDEAVPYATGKMLISAGGNGTDELRLRGLTVHGNLNHGPAETGNLEFHGGIEGGSTGGVDNPDLGVSTGTGTIPNIPPNTLPGFDFTDRTKWQRTDARMLSSIKLKEDGSGFTMKMGGPGNIFSDMTRLTSIGPGAYSNQVGNGACDDVDDAKCDDPTSSDVTAVFDNPARDPDGDASYHFSMVVPVDPDTPITETRGDNSDGISPPDWVIFTNDRGERAYRVNPGYDGVVGDNADTTGYANVAGEEYTDPADGSKYKVLWLSRDIAVPTGATLLESRRARRIDSGRPADQQGVYTVKLSNYAGVDGDDAHRYLRYAAYGLFNFSDYSNRWPRFLRIQAFHFGYDAFSGEGNNRPRDFSADVTTATFTGKTTGWILRNPEGGYTSQLVRLRGDVSLTATLGGGASDGAIEGSMENFEYLRNGAWTRFAHGVLSHYTQPTENGVNLESADIGADGSYAGVAKVKASANRRFGEGRYGGSLYGPRELGKIETAGYWMLPRHIGEDSSRESCHTDRTGSACITFGSIIGSFGAKSEE